MKTDTLGVKCSICSLPKINKGKSSFLEADIVGTTIRACVIANIASTTAATSVARL